MKTITIEIPEGKKAEWVDGVLTLVDEQPKIEFKFKMGDKVFVKGDTSTYKVVANCVALRGKPFYTLSLIDKITLYPESDLEPYTEQQDITERIKAFDDACEWCENNGKENLVLAYKEIYYQFDDMADMDDVFAYLKLRIITCALNEGWEPKFDGEEKRCYGWYFAEDGSFIYKKTNSYRTGTSSDSSSKLVFKSEALAAYAATQFKDIYMDFCYKGKE